MRGSTLLAGGILCLWLAGLLFYVAFHPGGVKLTGADGKQHEARNPVDILKYIMSEAPGFSQAEPDTTTIA